MADNNLNPGQQRYGDLYSQSGNISDTERAAANDYEKDYSNPLNQAEQEAAKEATPHNTKRDIQYIEAISSMDASSFDKIQSWDTEKLKANKHKWNQMSKFKRRLIGGGLVFITGGGLLMTAFTALSGPMQLVQAAELIKDFQLFSAEGQKSARSMNVSQRIARIVSGDDIPSRVKSTRLGILGLKQSQAMTDRLAKSGITFNTNSGNFAKEIAVDLDAYAGSKGLSADKLNDIGERIAKDMDLPSGKAKVIGNKLMIDGNLSYSQAKRAIAVLDDPGKWSLRSWTQTRSTLKGLGYTSWLHPFEKAKSKVYKTVTDFIDDQFGKITGDDNASSRIKSGQDDDVAKDHDFDVDGDDMTNSRVNEITDGIDNSVKKKGVRSIIGKVNDLTSSGKYNVAQLLIGVICMIQSIISDNGAYKMAMIANVAIKGTTNILGFGSQVQSGRDITLELAGLAVQSTMHDKVDVVDSDGNPTGQTEESDFWANCYVKGELGQPCEGDDIGTGTPGTLKTVASNATIFGIPAVDNIINTLLNNQVASMACLAFGFASDVLDAFDLVGNIVGTIISTIVEKSGVANSFMQSAINYFLGKPLDLESATPRQWGAISMFGGKFMANNQLINSGGKKLTSRQSAELKLENRRYLAWENNRKPLLARLVDPSDYNSSINQIARAVKLDTGSQDFATQLANVFKTFISAPSIIATAGTQLSGGSTAYAVAGLDYGVSDYAWSLDEMNEITSDYDVFENAEKAIDYLSKDSTTNQYHQYAEECLGVTIDSSYKVSSVDNDDGSKWNYVTMEQDTDVSARCKAQSEQSDFKTIRLYVMDYGDVVTGACYNGDSSDSDANSACSELGLDNGGGSSASASSSPQDADALSAQFESDTNGTGNYDGAYGRQCVDLSLWYVAKFTTLNKSSCNGNCFVEQMVAANPGLQISNTPQAPAIFSTCAGCLRSDPSAGHTGVVTSVDADGTIHTIETGHSAGRVWQGTYSPDKYRNNMTFVNVGDHLK